MIKRIIGVAAALGVVAIVVMTAVGSGSYSSMLPDDLFAATAEDVAGGEQGKAARGTADEVLDGGAADRADSLSASKPDATKGRK